MITTRRATGVLFRGGDGGVVPPLLMICFILLLSTCCVVEHVSAKTFDCRDFGNNELVIGASNFSSSSEGANILNRNGCKITIQGPVSLSYIKFEQTMNGGSIFISDVLCSQITEPNCINFVLLSNLDFFVVQNVKMKTKKSVAVTERTSVVTILQRIASTPKVVFRNLTHHIESVTTTVPGATASLYVVYMPGTGYVTTIYRIDNFTISDCHVVAKKLDSQADSSDFFTAVVRFNKPVMRIGSFTAAHLSVDVAEANYKSTFGGSIVDFETSVELMGPMMFTDLRGRWGRFVTPQTEQTITEWSTVKFLRTVTDVSSMRFERLSFDGNALQEDADPQTIEIRAYMVHFKDKVTNVSDPSVGLVIRDVWVNTTFAALKVDSCVVEFANTITALHVMNIENVTTTARLTASVSGSSGALFHQVFRVAERILQVASVLLQNCRMDSWIVSKASLAEVYLATFHDVRPDTMNTLEISSGGDGGGGGGGGDSSGNVINIHQFEVQTQAVVAGIRFFNSIFGVRNVLVRDIAIVLHGTIISRWASLGVDAVVIHHVLLLPSSAGVSRIENSTLVEVSNCSISGATAAAAQPQIRVENGGAVNVALRVVTLFSKHGAHAISTFRFADIRIDLSAVEIVMTGNIFLNIVHIGGSTYTIGNIDQWYLGNSLIRTGTRTLSTLSTIVTFMMEALRTEGTVKNMKQILVDSVVIRAGSLVDAAAAPQNIQTAVVRFNTYFEHTGLLQVTNCLMVGENKNGTMTTTAGGGQAGNQADEGDDIGLVMTSFLTIWVVRFVVGCANISQILLTNCSTHHVALTAPSVSVSIFELHSTASKRMSDVSLFQMKDCQLRVHKMLATSTTAHAHVFNALLWVKALSELRLLNTHVEIGNMTAAGEEAAVRVVGFWKAMVSDMHMLRVVNTTVKVTTCMSSVGENANDAIANVFIAQVVFSMASIRNVEISSTLIDIASVSASGAVEVVVMSVDKHFLPSSHSKYIVNDTNITVGLGPPRRAAADGGGGVAVSGSFAVVVFLFRKSIIATREYDNECYVSRAIVDVSSTVVDKKEAIITSGSISVSSGFYVMGQITNMDVIKVTDSTLLVSSSSPGGGQDDGIGLAATKFLILTVVRFMSTVTGVERIEITDATIDSISRGGGGGGGGGGALSTIDFELIIAVFAVIDASTTKFSRDGAQTMTVALKRCAVNIASIDTETAVALHIATFDIQFKDVTALVFDDLTVFAKSVKSSKGNVDVSAVTFSSTFQDMQGSLQLRNVNVRTSSIVVSKITRVSCLVFWKGVKNVTDRISVQSAAVESAITVISTSSVESSSAVLITALVMFVRLCENVASFHLVDSSARASSVTHRHEIYTTTLQRVYVHLYGARFDDGISTSPTGSRSSIARLHIRNVDLTLANATSTSKSAFRTVKAIVLSFSNGVDFFLMISTGLFSLNDNSITLNTVKEAAGGGGGGGGGGASSGGFRDVQVAIMDRGNCLVSNRSAFWTSIVPTRSSSTVLQQVQVSRNTILLTDVVARHMLDVAVVLGMCVEVAASDIVVAGGSAAAAFSVESNTLKLLSGVSAEEYFNPALFRLAKTEAFAVTNIKFSKNVLSIIGVGHQLTCEPRNCTMLSFVSSTSSPPRSPFFVGSIDFAGNVLEKSQQFEGGETDPSSSSSLISAVGSAKATFRNNSVKVTFSSTDFRGAYIFASSSSGESGESGDEENLKNSTWLMCGRGNDFSTVARRHFKSKFGSSSTSDLPCAPTATQTLTKNMTESKELTPALTPTDSLMESRSRNESTFSVSRPTLSKNTKSLSDELTKQTKSATFPVPPPFLIRNVIPESSRGAMLATSVAAGATYAKVGSKIFNVAGLADCGRNVFFSPETGHEEIDVPPLGWDANPFMISFGSPYPTHNGAIFSALCVIAAWLLLASCIGLVRGKLLGKAMDKALRDVHVPGTAIVPAGAVLPSAASAFATLARGHSASVGGGGGGDKLQIVVISVGCLCAVIMPLGVYGWICYKLRDHGKLKQNKQCPESFPLHSSATRSLSSSSSSSSRSHSCCSSLRSFLSYCFDSRWSWKPTKFVRQWLPAFEPFSHRWFLLVDNIIVLVLAIVSGMSTVCGKSVSCCESSVVVGCIAATADVALLVVMRPYLIRFEVVALPLICIANAVISVLVVVVYFSPSSSSSASSLRGIIAVLTEALFYVAMGAAAVQLLSEIVPLADSLVAALYKRCQQQEGGSGRGVDDGGVRLQRMLQEDGDFNFGSGGENDDDDVELLEPRQQQHHQQDDEPSPPMMIIASPRERPEKPSSPRHHHRHQHHHQRPSSSSSGRHRHQDDDDDVKKSERKTHQQLISPSSSSHHHRDSSSIRGRREHLLGDDEVEGTRNHSAAAARRGKEKDSSHRRRKT